MGMQNGAKAGGGGRIVASAPGKVILFGEHFVVYGSSAILCAIDRRVHVGAAKSDGIRITSELGMLECESFSRDAADVDPVLRPLYHIAKEACRMAGRSGGITLDVKSEIPPGAGLGSSSACCVAGAAAALRVLGQHPGHNADTVMRVAAEAERTAFPNASGADTAASALGGMITYDIRSGWATIRRQKGGPGFGLVVSDSGTKHNTESVVGMVSGFKGSHPEEFEELSRMESGLVSDVTELLVSGALPDDAAGSPAPSVSPPLSPPASSSPSSPETPQAAGHGGGGKTAASMLGRWASLNQSYLSRIGVSNARLDKMIDEMNGVTHGSKITGAGGGGCAIAFTDPDGMAGAAADLASRGHDCFAASIDYNGCTTS